MLYIIGLGLNVKGISLEGVEILKKCKKVYLENYTVDYPYSKEQLQEVVGKKITLLNREEVEEFEFIDEAQRKDVGLLVYGHPLIATTHITLLQECQKSGIRTKIVHSASILDAVSETGLQAYKFGKVASMPAWKKSFEPDSFMEIIKENKSIKAHSLILIDIGLEFQSALEQLEKSAKKNNLKINQLIVCQNLGTNKQKIFYKNIEEFKEFTGIRKPYCIIIPGKLHFLEKEVLESYQKY